MAVIMDGKSLAAEIKADILREVRNLSYSVCLAVIIVGENPASRIYVNSKKKDCEECGIKSEEYALPADVGEERLLALVAELQNRTDVNGILVQLPLPEGYGYHADKIIRVIPPEKDVDAFHPYNVGLLMTGHGCLLPCTPAGVMALLDKYAIDPAGKRCVVIGRSDIVGKPQAMLLLQRDATVTICHSKTENLAEITREADILISAVGRPNLITADMVKQGAAVIDVAMNRNDRGKLCGDVDFQAVRERASYITPVPGGVGPMTRAILMKNTVTAAKLQNS